jgi:DNA-binding transcriptional ArsR family regulator
MSIWAYDFYMARAATTTDAFNAVAEPRRRRILDVIADGELSVTDLVRELGVPQPLVSKHLRVLRETGLVVARDDGRQRLYRLNGPALKPIYDWVHDFERLWSERFGRMDEVLAELTAAEAVGTRDGTERTEDGHGSDDN